MAIGRQWEEMGLGVGELGLGLLTFQMCLFGVPGSQKSKGARPGAAGGSGAVRGSQALVEHPLRFCKQLHGFVCTRDCYEDTRV